MGMFEFCLALEFCLAAPKALSEWQNTAPFDLRPHARHDAPSQSERLLMQGYDKRRFKARTANGHMISHNVYTKGQGPVVVIIQELPGIGQSTFALADRFEAEGFTVVLPHLFGRLGKTSQNANLLRVMCMRREFRLFEKGKTSPIVDWLRALCQDLKSTHSVNGVATIGMCLTGNFAISLMVDDAVLAAVSSQPSLPIGRHEELHMSGDDITTIRDSLEAKGPMQAYRFEGDVFCRAEKFARLDETFNQDRERIRLTTLPGDGHAVLTHDFVDEADHPTTTAFQDVLSYFKSSLRQEPA